MGKDRQFKPNTYCTIKSDLKPTFYNCGSGGLFVVKNSGSSSEDETIYLLQFKLWEHEYIYRTLSFKRPDKMYSAGGYADILKTDATPKAQMQTHYVKLGLKVGAMIQIEKYKVTLGDKILFITSML